MKYIRKKPIKILLIFFIFCIVPIFQNAFAQSSIEENNILKNYQASVFETSQSSKDLYWIPDSFRLVNMNGIELSPKAGDVFDIIVDIGSKGNTGGFKVFSTVTDSKGKLVTQEEKNLPQGQSQFFHRYMYTNPGSYTISLHLDTKNLVYEENEDNNIIIRKILISEKPMISLKKDPSSSCITELSDLKLRISSIDNKEKQTASVGDGIGFGVNVKNCKDGRAYHITWDLYDESGKNLFSYLYGVPMTNYVSIDQPNGIEILNPQTSWQPEIPGIYDIRVSLFGDPLPIRWDEGMELEELFYHAGKANENPKPLSDTISHKFVVEGDSIELFSFPSSSGTMKVWGADFEVKYTTSDDVKIDAILANPKLDTLTIITTSKFQHSDYRMITLEYPTSHLDKPKYLPDHANFILKPSSVIVTILNPISTDGTNYGNVIYAKFNQKYELPNDFDLIYEKKLQEVLKNGYIQFLEIQRRIITQQDFSGKEKHLEHLDEQLKLNKAITKEMNSNVPDWVKNNARWWIEGKIPDNEFNSAIGYLIKEKVIDIPDLSSKNQENIKTGVPFWVKNNVKWWIEGKITEVEFLNTIKFLVQKDIIRLS